NNKTFLLHIVQEQNILKYGLPTTFSPWFVIIKGVEGNPGLQTTRNWFRIEKFYGDYKLVFCPLVCKFCKVLCSNVGIFMNDGVQHLAQSDVPFNVIFLKA
ncbi:hypothetical protein CICLE_v10023442mg, partial [Citrus x clementina]